MKSNASIGTFGVVDDRQRLLDQAAGPELEERPLLVGLVELFLALEHRVEALDGRDDDLARGGDGVRGEMLDVVLVGELVAVDGADVLLKLPVGLPPEVGRGPPGTGSASPRRI